MLNLFSQSQPAFGLDISASSIKLLQFGKAGKKLDVAAFSEVAVPKNVVINDAIGDPKVFGYLLEQAMGKMQFGKLSAKYAVASLPESKSFVRVIQIPKMSDSEAQSAVPYEAESFIPLPVDQVYLDWQKIGEDYDKMSILIVASPKDYVENFLSVMDQAGIKLSALEVESQSCVRSVISHKEPQTALIVDLDATRSSLIMVEDGNLQFTSTIPIAGTAFTESISRILGVSSVKAEDIKRKVGLANTAEYPNIKTAMAPILNNLAAEIKNILKFHAEHSGKQVTKILLVGGSAKLKNLPDFLAGQFSDMPGLKVELGNPWVNLESLAAPMEARDSLSFSTVIGLAMRGINYF